MRMYVYVPSYTYIYIIAFSIISKQILNTFARSFFYLLLGTGYMEGEGGLNTITTETPTHTRTITEIQFLCHFCCLLLVSALLRAPLHFVICLMLNKCVFWRRALIKLQCKQKQQQQQQQHHQLS